MTKRIRIENADNSNHKVVVQVWEEQHGDVEDKLVEEVNLLYPTDLIDRTIWKNGRYLVVKEI